MLALAHLKRNIEEERRNVMPVDDADFQAAISAMMDRIRAASPKIAVACGQLIQRAGMKKTHVRSGTLRRSWKTEAVEVERMAGARVGPTTVYARRQELASKARTVRRIFHNDPGWPSLKPAYEESKPLIGRLAQGMWATAMRG